MTDVAQAVRVLRAGALVAFPTETVYGLGADASNASAVRRIFAAKGRPAHHPLIVHLGASEQLDHWARTIPASARVLAKAFWPGPLTLILQRASHVIDEVTGGQDSVGLRVPSHPLARQLLQAFGGGVAAPSANRFGRISPTTAEHVRAELGAQVDLILDGGPCEVGIESSILDLSSGTPVLLRPGQITLARMQAVLGQSIGQPHAASPRASGTLAMHYAPSKPLHLIRTEQLAENIDALCRAGTVAVFARMPPRQNEGVLWRAAPNSSDAYAHDLYAVLRELDASPCASIVVEAPPDTPEWHGIRDRLARSAAGSGEEPSDVP